MSSPSYSPSASRARDPLREYLRRAIGWSSDRSGAVDLAVGAVRELAAGRGVLVIVGQGSLAGVARRLHKLTVPAQPFVALGRGEQLAAALERAAGGHLYLDARPRSRAVPRHRAPLLASVRDPVAGVRLIVGAEHAEDAAAVVAGLPQVATIVIPPLRERPEELAGLIEAYAQEAMEELGAPEAGLRPRDLEWLRASPSWLTTLDDVADATRRLTAIRTWGISEGAARLGVTHGALSRWATRRGIVTS